MVPGSGYEVLWATGVDLAGLVGNYYFKVECSDVDIGVSDTIVFRLDNNYPPVVKIDSVFGIKRVTGSYKDTLRFFFTVTELRVILL